MSKYVNVKRHNKNKFNTVTNDDLPLFLFNEHGYGIVVANVDYTNGVTYHFVADNGNIQSGSKYSSKNLSSLIEFLHESSGYEISKIELVELE